MIRSLFFVACSLALLGCSAEMKRETCGDGIDNDGNGLTDCQDPDCAGQPMCAPPFYGSCSKCGQACTSQSACVVSYPNDRPVPLCTDGICQATEKFIQPRIELSIPGWNVLSVPPRSAATRFIKKTAADGSAVNCSRVSQIASDRTVAGAIEASGQLQVMGLDITRVTDSQAVIRLAFVNTQTGSDYLIWVELWGGYPDSNTQLPTGRRLGWGCFESAEKTAPLVPEDNCPSTTTDAGVCRVFQLVMPAPEP
jgi:hypothetical protein